MEPARFIKKVEECEDNILKARTHRVMYPPMTFYASTSMGNVELLERIFQTDPYYSAQDYTGGGSPLHYTASYGRPEAIPVLLERGARINQRDMFGMTPLHRAATLLQKLAAWETLRHEYECLCEKLRGTPSTTLIINDRNERKRLLKASRKNDSRRLKEIEEKLAKPLFLFGAERAIDTYRALLCAGADCNADENFLKITPRALAKRNAEDNFASEIEDEDTIKRIDNIIAEIEGEISDAPVETGGDDSFERKWRVSNYNETEEEETPHGAEKDDVCFTETEALDALQNLETDEIEKATIENVPGAFILRGVIPKAASRILANYVEQIQPDSKIPRRETIGTKMMRKNASLLQKQQRNHDEEEQLMKGFKILTLDPLTCVSTTDTFRGESRLPVEPASWEVGIGSLSKLAKKIRPFLPLRSGADGQSNGYLCASDEHLLDQRLRCYRYFEKTCSIPHYDKATILENGLRSAHSLVVYLNQAITVGGETGFFVDENLSSRKSKSGLTKTAGDGNFPLLKYVNSVECGCGDVIVFPHGSFPNDFEHFLHDGRDVVEGTKIVFRTDVFYSDSKNDSS